MSGSALLAFLTGAGVNGSGRTFDAIIAFDNAAIEHHHDFIQWLFPLDEASRAVPGSPVLDEATIAALHGSAIAQNRIARASERMLRFYRDTTAWRRPFDHNHLRITRIIKSLRILAGAVAADTFKHAIVDLAADAPIDPTARRFWDRA